MPYKDKNKSRENQRERNKRWRERHKERARAFRQAHYWTDPDKYRERARKWYRDNQAQALESSKTRQQLKRYGITLEQLNELGKVCYICGATSGNSKGHRLHIDHCAVSGRVRGRLCNMCNRGIGCFHDRADLLLVASNYLSSTSTTGA